jgi:hypothetical protein
MILSKKACERVVRDGTNNFKADKGLFKYKDIEIQTDSRLEKAAIVYLLDVFKCDKIEKYKNIINFKCNNKHYHFNPDFYVKKNDKIFIIEVKMKWTSNSKHPYYSLMPHKKEALKIFCKEKGYEMIWLDFDYDIEFKKIYKNFKNTI